MADNAEAYIGFGTLVLFENPSALGTYIPLCFTEWSQPEEEYGEKEVTSSCHTGKRFISTLADFGSTEIEGNYQEDYELTKYQILRDAVKSGVPINFRVEWKSLPTPIFQTFEAVLKRFQAPVYSGREDQLMIKLSAKANSSLSDPIVIGSAEDPVV